MVQDISPIYRSLYGKREEQHMNLWDSVHRGLEKASQEAARIARTQRLRSTIDKLTRDIDTQQGTLITQAMALFASQQLTQSELLSICQQLADLHQQLTQAQNELKQLHQGLAQPATPPSTPTGPNPATSDIAPTVYAPPLPQYQPYIDSTVPIPTPPPPPGMEPLAVSPHETGPIRTGDALSPLPDTNKQFCTNCQTEALPGNDYCHNCGLPLHNVDVAHLPTVRGKETADPADQETILIGTESTPPETPINNAETTRDEPSSSIPDNASANKEDEGD